jgi:hypothetical protein
LDPGLTWTLTLGPCTPNGLTADSERFDVTSNWQIKHLPSGLCVTALDGDGNDASPIELTLQKCVHDYAPQQFRNDYTQLRNQGVHSLSNAKGDFCATRDGKLTLTGGSLPSSGSIKPPCAGTDDGFVQWALYPNTNQLRNTFGYNPLISGRAQCVKAVQRRGLEQDETEKELPVDQ